MREKQPRFVVTFRTTAEAMAMEKRCRDSGVPGRLIPLPRAISAGCGMCWSAPDGSREAVEELLMTSGFRVDGLYDMLL
ncbi:DUF3343 domain-containing protein [Dysosmobacter sp.]|uniref:DUF3343 domain-containing protein n=1 Tax=Dysosmobacter sp. TaxID=2591382 RepID=UPI002A8570ED|nr:DUF3343 domain-containing protein [Dysosmobacter sp.]MDY3280868.1 DUF3343 domain-containing protein [Dysosmobacter sp.]